MAQDDLIIGFQADTNKFQMDVEKAFKVVTNFADKSGDAGKSIEQSFKKLSQAAYNSGGEIQKAFNSLNISSDFTMKLQQEQLQRAKQFFQSQFEAIAKDANTSAADAMRAFDAFKNIEAKLNLQTSKGQAEASRAAEVAAEEKAATERTAVINKLRAASVNAEVQRTLQAEAEAAKRVVAEEQAAAARIAEINKLRAASVNAEVQRTLQAEKAAAQKIAAFREVAAAERASYAAQGMSGSGAAATLIGQPLAGSGFGNDLRAQMEASAASAQIRSREMASYAASAMQGEAAAARLSGHVHAGADFTSQLKAQMQEAAGHVEKTADHTERARNGINGWSLASVAAIAKVQILYSIINNIMGTIAQFPGQAIAAVEDYKSSVISNAAIITSMQKGVQDVGVQYQKNKVYAEGVQQTLIKMDANTAANIKNLGDMNNQFVQQGVLIDANSEKQKKGFLNIANYLATITANDPNKDMQYSQELRSMKDFSTRAGNRLVQYLETQGVTKEMVEGWKEYGRVTENNGYLLEKLAPYFKGFEAAQSDINGLLATAKSTLTTIYTEVLRGGLTPAVDALNKKMNELVDWASKHKEEIAQGLYRGWLEVKGVIESVYLTLKLIQVPINLINKATEPLGFGVRSIFEGWSLIGAVALPTVMEKLLQVAKVAEGISKYNLLGGLFGSAETKAQIKIDRAQLQKDLNAVADLSGFDARMAAWNVKFKPSNTLGENPSDVGGKTSKDVKTTADKYNAFENKHYKLLLKNIDEYNKKLNEQQKDFYNLSIEIDRTTDAEKRLFNLQNMQTGDLKTDRYKVTPLSKYGLNTAYYGIPMQKTAFDKDADKIKRIKDQLKIDQMAFDNAEMQNSGGMWGKADNYESLSNKYGKDSAEVQARLDELAIFKELDAEQLASKEELLKKQILLEEQYATNKKKIDANNIVSIGQSMGQIAAVMMKGNKEQFEAGKKLAIASATVQMFAAAAAAFAGITTSTGGWGIAAAVAAAAVAVATGSAQIAQIASTKYEGREFGGPVTAGQTYIVGEKRPELFTPGASGVITPYVPSAGQGQNTSVTQVIQVSTGVVDTVRSEISRLMPMLRAQAVAAVQQAQRSGQMQAA